MFNTQLRNLHLLSLGACLINHPWVLTDRGSQFVRNTKKRVRGDKCSVIPIGQYDCLGTESGKKTPITKSLPALCIQQSGRLGTES